MQNNNQEVNLQILFDLLSHKQINYAVFGVSRIPFIAYLLGTDMTASKLIPALKQFLYNKKDQNINKHSLNGQLDPQIVILLSQAIMALQGKDTPKQKNIEIN